MTFRSTHIGGGETPGLAGLVEVSPSVAASPGDCVVIQFPTPLPPPWAGEDGGTDCWESVGLLAVRICGQFDRPRVLVWSQEPDWEEARPLL